MKCPKCDSENLWASDACHTWPGSNGTWMSCMGCFSAIQYTCDDCSWTYYHGLNKRNPRSEQNEQQRPDWLDKEVEHNKLGDVVKHKDIKWYWEDEEE